MHLEPRLKLESKTETEIRSRRKFPKLNTCSDRTDKWSECVKYCKQIDQLREEEITEIINKFKLQASYIFRVEFRHYALLTSFYFRFQQKVIYSSISTSNTTRLTKNYTFRCGTGRNTWSVSKNCSSTEPNNATLSKIVTAYYDIFLIK